MILCGTWPKSLISEKRRLVYVVYSRLFQIIYCIFMISLYQGFYSAILENNLEKLSNSVMLCITYTLMLAKMFICMSRGFQNLTVLCYQTEIMLSSLKDESVQAIRKINTKSGTYAVYGFTIFAPFLGSTFLSSHFIEFELNWDPVKANGTERTLPYPSYLPFDTNMHYLTGFLINTIILIMSTTLYISCEVILITLLFSVSAKLEILQHFLTNVHEYAKIIKTQHNLTYDQSVFVTIRLCIIQHQHIMS